MSPALISCIVPVHNGERYLREALDSIVRQTYRPLEIIAVDDGSTDGTRAVIAAYGQDVRYVWQPNAGPAAARNCGLHTARADFLAFLDADDCWHPEKLARQMARFRARSELELCVTHLQNFRIPDVSEDEARNRGHRLATALPGYVTVTMLARRSLFERVGVFDTSLPQGEDIEWCIRALDHGAVTELLPDVLTHRRIHHGNLTRTLGPASRNEYLLRIMKAHLDRRRRSAAK